MNTVSAKFSSIAAAVDEAAIRPLPQSDKIHVGGTRAVISRVHNALSIGVAVRELGRLFEQLRRP